MTAIIAPQFLRDQNGGLSTKRLATALMLAAAALWLLFAKAGPPIDLPKAPSFSLFKSRKHGADRLLADIQNSTLGFEKIFVINLKARTDRKDGIALAGALTNLKFEFMEAATEVSKKALPPNPASDPDREYGPAHLGCWRSHLNAALRMVEEDIQTALILEDDADWDVRIHDQMTEFAKATRLLVQPLPGMSNGYLDPTMTANPEGQEPRTFIVDEHQVELPTTSPYGDVDRWDMLWVGHCGASVPDGTDMIPIGRAIVLNETTVPEQQHIQTEWTHDDSFKKEYPAHTRVVFRSTYNVCTLGYALTQQGARRILYEMGIREMAATADGGLDAFCHGRNGRPPRTCLTALPQYFQHHRPAGNVSYFTDISDPWGTDINPTASTMNIRYSTRLNMQKLVDKRTDFDDSYPDAH